MVRECQVTLHIPQTTQEEDLFSFHDLFRQIALGTLLEEKKEEISAQWRELNSYADLYDQADMELKRQIVSRVIQKVTISRGYKIDIELRIGLDAFQENKDRSEVND